MTTVDSNQSVLTIQKFIYVKSAFTGKASQFISNLPLSNSNSASWLQPLEHSVAIQALKVDTDSCRFIWVDILSEKLEAQSRQQVEPAYPGKTWQTLKELTEFKNSRVQSLNSEWSSLENSCENFKVVQGLGFERCSKDFDQISQKYNG